MSLEATLTYSLVQANLYLLTLVAWQQDLRQYMLKSHHQYWGIDTSYLDYLACHPLIWPENPKSTEVKYDWHSESVQNRHKMDYIKQHNNGKKEQYTIFTLDAGTDGEFNKFKCLKSV